VDSVDLSGGVTGVGPGAVVGAQSANKALLHKGEQSLEPWGAVYACNGQFS
jgi:hypothetical protein